MWRGWQGGLPRPSVNPTRTLTKAMGIDYIPSLTYFSHGAARHEDAGGGTVVVMAVTMDAAAAAPMPHLHVARPGAMASMQAGAHLRPPLARVSAGVFFNPTFTCSWRSWRSCACKHSKACTGHAAPASAYARV